MPVIHIEFDDSKIKSEDILALSNMIRKIVSDATEIDDVSVYANSAQIKIKVAPVEIFVQMTEAKIADEDSLIRRMSSELTEWKEKSSFSYPINLTLIPMKWRVVIGI